MVQRAILVLNDTPDERGAEVVALSTLTQYGGTSSSTAWWQTYQDLPTWVNIGLADQLNAHRRDAGPNACFMVISMTINSDQPQLRRDEQAT